MNKKLILTIASAFFIGLTGRSDTPLDEAVPLVESGRLVEAEEILENSKDPARFLWQGRIAFLQYDFPKATQLYGQYRRSLGKAAPAPETEMFSRQLEIAEQALESVADIEIIDSIAVPATTFLAAYRLPVSAGSIAEPEAIPVHGRSETASSVFFNELGNFAMWAEPDSTGMYRITESVKLTDGSWSEPRMASAILNNGGDADYPFMCADGTTLYFSSDGEDSMGGMDIFIASRADEDGTYLKPRNLGMPFNSPFDDFMLAVDEENGIGWWASDRNLLGDKLTLYVYALPDTRTNIDSDNPELLSLAALRDITKTQDEERDYTSLRKKIASIKPAKVQNPPEFRFRMPGKGELHYYSEFRTAEAKNLMKQYLAEEETAKMNSIRLDELRRKYHASKNAGARKALSGEIINLENEEAASRTRIKTIKNKIFKAEQGR